MYWSRVYYRRRFDMTLHYLLPEKFEASILKIKLESTFRSGTLRIHHNIDEEVIESQLRERVHLNDSAKRMF